MMYIKPPIQSRSEFWKTKDRKEKAEQATKTRKKIEIIFLVIIFILISWALFYGLQKQDRADCLKWQSWVKSYPEFYITKEQDQQCHELGITIGADVHE